MRTSTNNQDWFANTAGNLMGLNMGFEFCYEHENEDALRELKRTLGVPSTEFPLGVADRQITICPDELIFTEYDTVPRDKRRKPVKAASLLCLRSDWYKFDHLDLLKRLELNFYNDVGVSYHSPRDDLLCGWSQDFGINVRGAENVERLRRLYEAFKAKNIAVGWAPAGGLTFAITSELTDEIKANTLAKDEEHLRLHNAVKSSGIHATLEAAGKRFFALSPDWYDREKEERLLFFLNPCEQSTCHHGWFTVEELEEWAKGRGPVLKCKYLEAFSDARRDWHYNLVNGLQEAGISIRHHARLEWMDADETEVGIHVRPSTESRELLPEGVYPFQDLTQKYKPAPAPAAEPVKG